MRILDLLKRIVVGNKVQSVPVQSNVNMSSAFRPNSRCLIKALIKKSEFIILSKYYYRGVTSYKSLLRYVFPINTDKVLEVIAAAEEKAHGGCLLDDTYVVFYYDDTHFILMPFEVIADSNDMNSAVRNAKLWHSENIRRILQYYPEFADDDRPMITESDIVNLLLGE